MAKLTQGISKSDQAVNNVLRQIRNIKATEARGEQAIFTELDNYSHSKTKKESKKDIALTHKMAEGYKRKRKPSKRRIQNNLIELSKQTGVPVEVLRINPNLRPA